MGIDPRTFQSKAAFSSLVYADGISTRRRRSWSHFLRRLFVLAGRAKQMPVMLVCGMTRTATHRLFVVASMAALLLALTINNSSVTTTALPTSSSRSSTTTTTTTTTTDVIHSTLFHPHGDDHDDEEYIRPDDRLRRRDFIWRTARGGSQKWCGRSTFLPNVNEASSNRYYNDDRDPGPSVWDCQTFVNSALTLNGTWFVSNFGSRGQNWVEFSRVQSCKVAVRHFDGSRGTIP